MTLIERVRKALVRPEEQDELDEYDTGFECGVAVEHARTAKLVEALVEIAENSVIVKDDWAANHLRDLDDSVERLEAVVEEVEKS